MLNRKKLVIGLLISPSRALPLGLSSIHGHDAQSALRNLLSMPADSIRGHSGFHGVARFGVLLPDPAWAPRPQAEEEYAQNLCRQRVSIMRRDPIEWGISFSGYLAQSPKTMAVAEGRAILREEENRIVQRTLRNPEAANGENDLRRKHEHPRAQRTSRFCATDEVDYCNGTTRVFFQGFRNTNDSEEWREHFCAWPRNDDLRL